MDLLCKQLTVCSSETAESAQLGLAVPYCAISPPCTFCRLLHSLQKDTFAHALHHRRECIGTSSYLKSRNQVVCLGVCFCCNSNLSELLTRRFDD